MVEPQQKGQPASQPKPAAIPETPYRTDGTRLFRLVNFELFAVRLQNLPFDFSRRLLHVSFLELSRTLSHAQWPQDDAVRVNMFPFLLQRPTPRMRLLSIAGSGLFVGIMGYFTWSSHQAQKQKSLQRRQ